MRNSNVQSFGNACTLPLLACAGATAVVTAETEAGLAVGSQLAVRLGADPKKTAALKELMRQDMNARLVQGEERSGAGAARPGELSVQDPAAAFVLMPVRLLCCVACPVHYLL